MTAEDYRRVKDDRDLVRRVHRLERRAQKTGSADLRHAAIDGAGIPIKDENGNTTGYLGSGPTGVEHVNGPDPAQPAPAFVDAGGEVVKIQHSGLDHLENPGPADWRRTIVHASLEEIYEPSLATRAGYIDDLDGSFSHRLPGGEWWIAVQWETLSGKLSPVSEPVLADVDPLVDTQDLEDTLDAAQERIDAARDEAEPRFEALETGLATNESNISDATGRLTTAEDTIRPLPGQMAENKANVESARDEAAAASAAAVEANNRSMTRLANGNFENDLLYWEYQNITLADVAHSGQFAATIGTNGWLRPESSMPVVPEQIWELSLYHQGFATASFQAVDDGQLSTIETFTLDGTPGTWTDSGSLRVTIPNSVDMLTFTLSGTDARVDDITLRDVTDVVRLEQAARDASVKAENAQDRLDLMELAVDGEGGLKDRLATAETVLEDKADSSLLPELESRLTGAFGEGISDALGTAAADAQTKADKARDDAIAAAEADATAKANAAEEAAKTAAAQDAQTQADKARADAEAAAIAHADLVAQGASDTAIAEAERLHGLAMAEAQQAAQDAADAHTAAGDAQSSADAAMSRAGAAESNAIAEAERLSDAARAIAEEAKDQNRAHDTRDDNEPPQYYYTLFRDTRQARIVEFKRQGVIGLNASGSYAHVITHMSWTDPSGGPVRQEAVDYDNEVWNRISLSRDEWGPWRNKVADASEEAKEHADSLPKVLHGTTAPAGTAPDGSIWWQHQGALSGPVVGQWNRVDGSWQSTPIDSEAIANLDVGKLTAGAAEIAEAVLEKAWAELGVFDRLQAREGWIGGVNLENDTVTATKVHATREMIAKILGVDYAYVAELLVVEGDLIANNATLINAAMQNLSVTERADFVQAFAEQIYSKQSITEVLIAGAAWISGTLIEEGAITTPHLTVTEDMVGNFAEFLHLVVDRIDVNSLWADQTWQAAGHFGSTEANTSTLVDGTGLQSILHDTENGNDVVMLRLGALFGLVFANEQGEVTGSLSQEGDAALRDASVSTLTIGGRRLLPDDNPADFWDGNLWDSQPKGLVCFHETDMSGVSVNHDEYGFIEVSHPVKTNRKYRVSTNNFLMDNTGTYQGRFRYTIGDGTDTPHTESEQFGNTWVIAQSSNLQVTGNHTFTPTEDGMIRILLCVTRAGSATGVTFNANSSFATAQLRLEDLGPDRPYTGMTRTAGHGGQGTFRDPQPIGGAITTEWHAWWYQNYSHNGTTPQTDHESNWRHNPGGEGGYGAGGPTQGVAPTSGTGGTRWASIFGFPQAGVSSEGTELGKTLQQALAGAEIHSIIFEYQVGGSHHDNNVLRLNFGAHTNLSAPSQHPGSGVSIATDHLGRVGETLRLAIPVEQFGAMLKSGDFRSMGIRTGSNNLTYAGWVEWYSLRPKLIIRYTKEGN